MLNSDYRRLTAIQFPAYQARQKYMHTFDVSAPVMAEGFDDYIGPVTALLDAAGVRSGLAHMTVDEKIVRAGMSQRRPAPHVDGRFNQEAMRWGHPAPPWLHYCNHLPVARMAIIVAASVPGCRAWRGQFDGAPTEHGDLSHIAEQLGAGEVLPANVGYWLSPDCVHESMLFDTDTQRSFLRIALDGA